MNIFGWDFSRKPIDWTRRKSAGGTIGAALRDAQAMGPWSDIFGQWQPREHSPWLYEALREAIGVLDGGINRTVTLDGIIAVEGGNDALVQEIETWMQNVPVNDLETGYQAFYAGMGAEHYEQGCAIGEYVMDRRAREVVGLRVADSKGIVFTRDGARLRTFYRAPEVRADPRRDGLGSVEQILRGNVKGDVFANLRNIGYAEFDMARCVYAVNRPEADNPYGTSMLRSLPFVAQLLLKMQNSVGRTWERYGDPPFHVHYSTKNRKVDSAEAQRRATKMAQDLGAALAGKARGNSVDLATAAAADDDVKIQVIGASDVALEIEMPARNLLEQVVGAFPLAPWMLGITWSQAAGIGEQQSVMALQDSETRFELRRPALARPIEAMLRGRGRTWKAGDWKLVQRLPNLMDVQKRAQAEFLQAQTALMLGNSGQVVAPKPGTGIDNNLRVSVGGVEVKVRANGRAPHTHAHGKAADDTDDDSDHAESWAEDDPELPLIEARTIAALLAQWHALRDDAMDILGLPQEGKGAKAPGDGLFGHTIEQIIALLSRGDAAQAGIATALLDGQMEAWGRGVANAGLQLSVNFSDPQVAAAIGRARARAREAFARGGLDLVRGGFARQFHAAIVSVLASGAYDGMNPTHVARDLRRAFGGGDYNWTRLARSEVALSQSRGKLALLAEQGVMLYDFDTAPDACPICDMLKLNGPYRVGDPLAPLPVANTHPNCRCSIRPRA